MNTNVSSLQAPRTLSANKTRTQVKPIKRSSEAFFQSHVNLIFLLLYSSILVISSIGVTAIPTLYPLLGL